jgi:hypothetical protein
MEKLTDNDIAELSRADLVARFLELQEAFDLALKHIDQLTPPKKRPRGRPRKIEPPPDSPRGLVKMLLDERRGKPGRPREISYEVADALYSWAATIAYEEIKSGKAGKRFGLNQATEILVTQLAEHGLLSKVFSQDAKIGQRRAVIRLKTILKEHRRGPRTRRNIAVENK